MALVVALRSRRFEVGQDVIEATGRAQVEAYVAQQFGSLDITKTFETLVSCGSLLQIALTAAGEQPCSVSVLRTLSKFQNVVTDSSITSSVFVNCALEALRCHRDAMDMFEDAEDKEDLLDGVEELLRCAAQASDMAQKSGELAMRMDDLQKSAEEGLVQAKQDVVTNKTLEKKIEAELKDLTAKKAGQEATLSLLEADLAAAIEKEEKVSREAAEARERQFALELTGSILSGIGGLASSIGSIATPCRLFAGQPSPPQKPQDREDNSKGLPGAEHLQEQSREYAKKQGEVTELKSQLKIAEEADNKDSVEGKKNIDDLRAQIKAKETEANAANEAKKALSAAMESRAVSLEEKEAKATQLRNELARQKRELVGDLSQNLKQMETMQEDKTQVEQTVLTLGSCVIIMGVVKTTFLDAKIFWETISAQCKRIADAKRHFDNSKAKLQADQLEKAKKFLKKGVEESAPLWAGVGYVCYKANIAINEARENVNKIMCKLPTGDATGAEIKKLINKLHPTLQLQLTAAEEAEAEAEAAA